MIPGLSVRRGNQLALAIIAGMLLLVAFALRRVITERQDLKKYGVLVKAAVNYKQYPKGIGNFTVNFKYGGHYYYNTFRSGDFACRLGDSVTIKINAQNPAGYCVLAADSSQ